MEFEFTCQHSATDRLKLQLTESGDFIITATDGTTGEWLEFYVKPEDTGPLAQAVASLSAHRRRQVQTPPSGQVNPNPVPAYMTPGMPVPPQDYRTPEQVEADEMESKRERRQGRPVTFAEAMLPQPGTVDRERCFHRATELLGATASGESRVELARFLSGEGRAYL